MNSKYVKGRRLEAKTRALLEETGYTCIRAAGSKGVWDLIAWNSEKYRHIQVKANNKPSQREVERIEAQKLPPNAFKEVWIWQDYKRMPNILYLTV